jgi:hypothetical protein
MHGSREDLPTTIEAKEVMVREADWTGIHVGFETYNEDSDIVPLFEGLLDDRRQCSHWGYVFEGRMHVRYADHEEVFEAGDAYYISPGHTPFMEAGTEISVFSPKDAYRKTQEVTEVNFEVRQEAPQKDHGKSAVERKEEQHVGREQGPSAPLLGDRG